MTAQAAGLPGEVRALGRSVNQWPEQAAHEVLRQDAGMVTAMGMVTRVLCPDAHAVGEARRFTRSTLGGWQCGALIDDVAVIVSELLSNALRYGNTGPHRDRRIPPRSVRLGLLRRGRMILCAVCDHSSRVPVLKEPDYLAESGRGLHIVASLSDSWGWTAPGPGGKAVWAALSLR